MLVLAWVASWIALFCTGHTWGAWVDLIVGAGVWFLTALTVIGVGGSLIRKALKNG